MVADTIQSLRSVNHSLRTALGRLQPNRTFAPAPTEFSGLLAELIRATDCLRGTDLNSALDHDLKKAISEYRGNLEQLAKVLPSVSGRLLTEKARLEAARAHLTKAAAWAHASQKTL